FFRNYVQESTGEPLTVQMQVPASNPPLKTRHNRVNAYLHNDLGEARAFVYKGAPKLDEGFRLTKLKKQATYAEDDSKDYQHITTAAGYGICSTLLFKAKANPGTRYL